MSEKSEKEAETAALLTVLIHPALRRIHTGFLEAFLAAGPGHARSTVGGQVADRAARTQLAAPTAVRTLGALHARRAGHRIVELGERAALAQLDRPARPVRRDDVAAAETIAAARRAFRAGVQARLADLAARTVSSTGRRVAAQT